MIELKLKSKIIGQIHDAIVFDLYPPELLIIHEMVQRIGTIELREAYKWINVPLVIETELCPIDHSWAEKEEWKP
jgi:DNA polymerase I-like protein with 3'-5' exonuclease and polymerase domains